MSLSTSHVWGRREEAGNSRGELGKQCHHTPFGYDQNAAVVTYRNVLIDNQVVLPLVHPLTTAAAAETKAGSVIDLEKFLSSAEPG